MATIHAHDPQAPHQVFVKGSLESILARCKYTSDISGARVPLDEEQVRSQTDTMARKGLRVLAFATREVEREKTSLSHEDIGEGLIFLGLQGMIDPPRKEAIDAVHACQGAGIQVKMITGDHALTASAIAQQIGLYLNPGSCSPECHVLSGTQLEDLSDQELIDTVPETEVFARISPEQKLQLVRALQARGEIVAMTGDGVNDAPALRQADIGVAMGTTGTESLWINMTTAGSLGLMLAFEPKERGIVARAPQNPHNPILSKELTFRILLVGFLLLCAAFGLFEWEEISGASQAQARTVAVNAFAVISTLYLLNCRSLHGASFRTNPLQNIWVFLGIAGMIALQVAFTHVPFMNRFFHSAPTCWDSWVRVFAVGVFAHIIVEIEKWWVRRVKR